MPRADRRNCRCTRKRVMKQKFRRSFWTKHLTSLIDAVTHIWIKWWPLLSKVRWCSLFNKGDIPFKYNGLCCSDIPSIVSVGNLFIHESIHISTDVISWSPSIKITHMKLNIYLVMTTWRHPPPPFLLEKIPRIFDMCRSSKKQFILTFLVSRPIRYSCPFTNRKSRDNPTNSYSSVLTPSITVKKPL